mgnify:CR=1 FL=1
MKKTNKKSLDKSLEKTSNSFFDKIKKAVVGKTKVDVEVLDELEEILITSDVGVKTTIKIIDAIESRVAKEKYTNPQELDLILKEEIGNIIFDEKFVMLRLKFIEYSIFNFVKLLTIFD